jgi:hypothetical protein
MAGVRAALRSGPKITQPAPGAASPGSGGSRRHGGSPHRPLCARRSVEDRPISEGRGGSGGERGAAYHRASGDGGRRGGRGAAPAPPAGGRVSGCRRLASSRSVTVVAAAFRGPMRPESPLRGLSGPRVERSADPPRPASAQQRRRRARSGGAGTRSLRAEPPACDDGDSAVQIGSWTRAPREAPPLVAPLVPRGSTRGSDTPWRERRFVRQWPRRDGGGSA